MENSYKLFWFSVGFFVASALSLAIAGYAQEIIEEPITKVIQENNIYEEPEIEEIEIPEPKDDEGVLDRPITLENQPKPKRALLSRISNWFFPEKPKEKEEITTLESIINNAKYIIRQDKNIYYASNYQHDENGCISFSNVVICGTFIITKFK